MLKGSLQKPQNRAEQSPMTEETPAAPVPGTYTVAGQTEGHGEASTDSIDPRIPENSKKDS